MYVRQDNVHDPPRAEAPTPRSFSEQSGRIVKFAMMVADSRYKGVPLATSFNSQGLIYHIGAPNIRSTLSPEP